MDGPQEVTADTKKILNGSVHREKPLRLGNGLEAAHLTLPLAGRLCETSARLFSYCRVLWITDGITVRCAAE